LQITPKKTMEEILNLIYDDVALVQDRDLRKQLICNSNGITLITIPFWWNETMETIAYTVRQYRVDIPLPSRLLSGAPIPKEMPKQRQRKVDYYPTNVGQIWRLQNACFG